MGAYDPCFFSAPVTVLPEVNNVHAPEIKVPEVRVYGGNNPYDPWTSCDETLQKVQDSATKHLGSPSNTQPPIVYTPKVPVPPSSTKHNNFDIKATGAPINSKPKKKGMNQKQPRLLII